MACDLRLGVCSCGGCVSCEGHYDEKKKEENIAGPAHESVATVKKARPRALHIWAVFAAVIIVAVAFISGRGCNCH